MPCMYKPHLILEFTKCSEVNQHTNEWRLVGVANSNQQGTNERIKEKLEKIKKFAREAAKITSQQMLSLIHI